ncbi:MAG: hypothetical protein HOV81_32300 [Kofleriaceae bacterium]|nr:hypothetical protein [Kofleriaceae bacterium]
MTPRRHLCVVLALALFACGDQKLAPDAGSGICSDGIDNDGDGLTDYPADFGCENEADETEENTAPQCSDHRDNDGDGKTDFPEDPGCVAPNIDDEADDCPSGPNCPQCSDGKDNDQNGMTDWPTDAAGCESAGDTIEFTDNSVACGNGLTIAQLPLSGNVSGALSSSSFTNLTASCGNVATGAPGTAYVFHVATPQVIVATTEDSATTADTVLQLRSATCTAQTAELACHDDISSTSKASKITKSLGVGTYYLIVSGKAATDTGAYALHVQFFPGEGSSCTGTTDCGPGLVCRVPVGGTQMICTGPVCNDGRDDDADGKVDYPVDPGCATPDDSTENDTCATPSDPACPKCSNGIDDDNDGDTDYPMDSTCIAASTNAESCTQTEPILIATTPNTAGTTVGATHDFMPPMGQFNGHSCTSTFTNPPAMAPDVAVQFDIPAVDRISFRVNPQNSWDSVHVLLDSTCAGTPLECYDDPNGMSVSNLAAGRYYMIVDGWNASDSGAFNLNISGTIKNGASCESPLAQSGALTCNPGYACNGTPGSRTCSPTECNDGVDNNSDGHMDYPADPGCLTPNDLSENTVCPGASCPACSDGVDNDGDMQTDYPTDTGCLSAGQDNEGCGETEPLVAITAPSTTGTLMGATDDHDPRCSGADTPDRVYTLDIPTQLQSLRIDTQGSAVDTVLSFMNNTCAEPSIQCNDDNPDSGTYSLITRTNIVAGSYTIAVDSATSTLDTYVLNVHGVIRPGGSCESPLFQAGVLACPPSFGCNGAPGARTCSAAQCNDGADNNGDGKTDYPSDPGCDSLSDNSESNVCPGASCPACANGIDDDMDGLIDYPQDPGCKAASVATEGCTEPDVFGALIMPTTTGTLAGASDNHEPACRPAGDGGLDASYTLTVPGLESLTLDTNGSSTDTVLSFMNHDCTSPDLACDDNSGSGDASLITASNVGAGTYTIMVDSSSSFASSFMLNVSGVIRPGESCENPLVTTGALRCSLGFACKGPVGARTCALAECIDGVDNNSDGRTDFPADPGCDSFSDNTEAGVCPGPTCPICSDGIDNDMDGAIDYPMDPSCVSASANNETCDQSEAVQVVTQKITTGTTAGTSDDFSPSCAASGGSAGDVALQLDLPLMASLTLVVPQSGPDFTQSLLDSTCGGTDLACEDGSTISVDNLAAGTYYLVIDGWDDDTGPFTLTTTGIVAPGGSCEGALFQSGAFTCPPAHACDGTPGSRTCVLSKCVDNIDNDGDGKMDYPLDPGCSSISDNDETDDCFPVVGPACPACGNGLDDDTDSTTDFPMDSRCTSASFFMEDFCTAEADLGGMITEPTVTGTLMTAADNFTGQSCQGSTGNDRTWGLELPVPVVSLTVDTIGSVASDTILSVRNATCMTELGCDDDGDPDSARSVVTLSNVPAGKYAIVVDSYSSFNNDDVTVNVRGTVAAGTACTSDLFTTHVLSCPAGTRCLSGTCQ